MDYNFVEDLPDDYSCQICMKLLNEPQLTDCCGQHFCRACLDQWFQQHGKKQCPHCRSEHFNHILYLPLKRKINQLKVYCSNREKGCGLSMKLEGLERHLSHVNPGGCGYSSIECPNKCGESIIYRDMANHRKNRCPYRKTTCKHCGEVGTHQDITGYHAGFLCQKYPVDCRRKCGVKGLKRKDLADHDKVCPLEPVQCPFRGAGCKQQLVRKDLKSHIESSTQQHLLGLMTAYTKEHKELKILRTTVAGVASKLEDIQKTASDRTVATSLEQIKTTLNQVVLRLEKEGDQLIFRFPCDSWDWVSPTFTLGDKKMYLALNPPDIVNYEYNGTLSVMMLNGQLDVQNEINVETELDHHTQKPLPHFNTCVFYDPNIKLCAECSTSQRPKQAFRPGQEIGRVNLPYDFKGGHLESCVATLTLKAHHCMQQTLITSLQQDLAF